MRVIAPTAEAVRFLSQWRHDAPFIEARTSGSTGAPKTIHLAKEDMRRSARATNERFGIDPGSVLLCPLSVDYIAGKMMVVRALEAGCTLALEPPSNRPLPPDTIAAMAAAGISAIDLAAIVPSQIESLVTNEAAHRLLRNVIVGGAPMSARQEEMLTAAPWHSFATYGMTETCSHVALRRVGADLYHAMPGVRFALDGRGCLVINAEGRTHGPLTTNDLAEIASDTSFRWIGRYDNVINSGGVKFSPEALEAMLTPHIYGPFYITSEPHPQWGSVPVLVVRNEGQQPEQLLQLCRQHLPRYACPRRVVILPDLPRTASGKILRLGPPDLPMIAKNP